MIERDVFPKVFLMGQEVYSALKKKFSCFMWEYNDSEPVENR